MSLPELYTTEEVAQALRLPSTNWLEDAARLDEIPHTRLGRRLRFTRQQYEQVIEIHAKNVKPPTPLQPKPTRTPQPAAEPVTKARRLQARIPARMRNAAA
ncbi:helix-turn-helix domain-containing protein [Nocardia ninae]|uniref:Helix-turn-helix domain-containing protein n=1 Tax=Nocardia ninae NBRC 108245 TaxID=1210091 RepID=A0A511MA11_9NOCA|nr:helix-turn-helix domain-containing protein [Nocardia ninae]GEM37504.1 hypothetical protein NN4_20230 [Nocardia ninae NBRC 108245]